METIENRKEEPEEVEQFTCQHCNRQFSGRAENHRQYVQYDGDYQLCGSCNMELADTIHFVERFSRALIQKVNESTLNIKAISMLRDEFELLNDTFNILKVSSISNFKSLKP